MNKSNSFRIHLFFLTCLILIGTFNLSEVAFSKVKKVIKLPQKTFQSNRTLRTKKKKRVIKKITNQETQQEFFFMGCKGEERGFKEIAETLIRAQKAWDNHNSKALAKEYTKDFRSHYGTPMIDLIKDLEQFWAKYKENVSLESFPNVVFVCDNSAYVNLAEIMKAKFTDNNKNKLETKSQENRAVPETITWINGITRLKRTPDGWKISAEEILSEESWFYYGDLPKKLLEKRFINFDVPVSANAGENYIASLKYVLPQNVAVNLLIKKEEISDYPNSKSQPKKREIKKLKRTVLGTNFGGIERILKANSEFPNEKVSVQMTFLGLNKDTHQVKSFLGYLEIAKKLTVKLSKENLNKNKEDNNFKTKKKTFKEEVLNQP